MENLDVYILTSVIATAFAVLIIGTYREFLRMSKEPFKSKSKVELVELISQILEDKKINKKEKKVIYQAMFKTISDMESDGVYFSEEVKEEMAREKEDSICHYSGLPSMKTYE